MVCGGASTLADLIYSMLMKRLPILFLCLIKRLKAAVPSLSDTKALVDDITTDGTVPQILDVSDRLSRMTLTDNIPENRVSDTKSPPSLFEISGQISKLIEVISALDTKTAVEMIEAGLGQILVSGVCLHDIAPTIGSLPIEAKELVLAAVEAKAYTLLKLLQKAYIWRDEQQYHWFMALSYSSPWYEKEMWENPEPFSLDWEKNLWAVCEVENVALAAMLREKALQGNTLEDFDAKLLSQCIEYDSVEIFEFTKLDPVQLKEHLEPLAKNSAANLLQLYQTHTKVPHLHLEEFPFPSKLPASVDGFNFLMKNGYNFLSMKRFIEEFCKKGRLDLLKYLQEFDPVLYPKSDDLKYAAASNFKNILAWAHNFEARYYFPSDVIFEALLVNRHFDTLYWWIDLKGNSINSATIIMIVRSGALEVLQWVGNREPIGSDDIQEVVDAAAWARHLPILEWLYEKYKVLPKAECFRNATTEILDWVKPKSYALQHPQLVLKPKDNDLSYENLVGYGAGNFELLQWVFKNAPIYVFDGKREILTRNIRGMEMMLRLHKELKICPFDVDWAYETGDLEAIQWAAENCSVYPTYLNTCDAVEKGHFHVITWIHKNLHQDHPLCFNIDTLKAAIKSGNLEIAEYLIENIFPKAEINVSSRDTIPKDKLFAIFKWAHERGISIAKPEDAMITATCNNNVEVLEWFSINLPTVRPVPWWGWLVANDLDKPYKWLLEKYPEMYSVEELGKDARDAYRHGSLSILKVLNEKYPSLLQATPPWDRADKKNYHVCQWLFANGYWVEKV